MNRADESSRKSRIAQLRRRKNLRRNISKSLIQALAWIGFAVLYYIIFSLLFDTPYEYYLKRSSQRLSDEYTRLENRYDSLMLVMKNISERDINVSNIMFEASPMDLEIKHKESILDLHEASLGKSSTELMEQLNSRCWDLERNVTALHESTHRMVSNIEALGRKTANIPSIQPIANRQLTLLTASYGERIHPFYKTLQPHLGIDYSVPEGTRVFATADGVIKSYTLSSSPSGKSILIDHENGYETYYAHLDKIDIPRSRRVKRGDIIGMSGNTGLSFTPHLHYEVRYNGEKIDPINYLFMELNPSRYQRIQKIAETGMQAFD